MMPTFSHVCAQGAVNSIVDGLFSALVTLGTVPIIKCPKVRSDFGCLGVLHDADQACMNLSWSRSCIFDCMPCFRKMQPEYCGQANFVCLMPA